MSDTDWAYDTLGLERCDPYDAVLAEVHAEAHRQDEIHPAGYPATRDGIRLGIATAQDELDEAREAHRSGRREESWGDAACEAIQAAAVLLRMVRAIRWAEGV